ncbi:class V chitinase-like [Bidens hawaiensis]|uniref:class V chitinase-like n=1 Tax=Bidens hawaiensis TaxID=980011 RepID=UPI00404B0182
MSQPWIKAGFWYTGSAYPTPDINSALFTHLICAFAYINPLTHKIYLTESDEPYVSTFVSTVKKSNPSVKPLLSIWTENELYEKNDGNSSNFLLMTQTPAYQKSFIESSIKMAQAYGFEGLDLYVSTLLNTKENMTSLGNLFNEWRVALDQEKIILTMGVQYSPDLNSVSYQVDSVKKTFDWVHVRSYDYHTPMIDNFTGAHSALYDPSSYMNTNYGINEWLKRGLPANQLVLGLAYHGYAWTLVDPKDNRIGAPAKGPAITSDGSLSYEYIKRYLRSYKVNLEYNSTYVINYCTIGSFWIGFDDVEAIRVKVAYAKKKGLRGYNVWEVPHDYNWVLSKVAAQGDQYNHHKLLLRITLCTIASFILLLGCVIYYLREKIILKVKYVMNRGKSSYDNHQVISFADLWEATNSFSEDNKLGEGGYGPVYKGTLLNGQEIAVKRLSHSSKQGIEEFKNEVAFATKLQHVNLVKLLGFCTEREEMMLIYEYMPNKSLDLHLFYPSRRSMLSWQKWVEIIEGIIQGLLYLQEYSRLTIVHRDLKASNILLDADMKPKISDFGIAKSFQNNEVEASTGRIVGTYGCVPPEYVKEGLYS